ncbi:MAG: protein-glutamate O-methyltransferase CheR [Pseudomonadales bacterium]|nr:protein-glutamate O-methyltransferase CheR [Pseudomonadales bacterium]NRA18267.1 protein-glutamate O-methyltransferase CheR [Oceanospirillaceae bacterium]
MKTNELELFEIKQLLEAIYFRYGYDFRHYAQASLERRIRSILDKSNCNSIAELNPKILHDTDFFDLFLKNISINVTEMFRDPYVFAKIRTSVFNLLSTYPHINIWHVGCSTGEEVYSMAIMLKEEGLLKSTQIYATDFNKNSLEIAEKGIYKADRIKNFSENYLAAGAKGSFSDYFNVHRDTIKIRTALKKNITFSYHNLTTDQVFSQMHLIVCRNVLIYFDRDLQNKVLNLFKDSLIHKGFLVLGDKESIQLSDVSKFFSLYERKERIYQLDSCI